ncbi:hypothetical protein K3495_g9703 [Podosphaera aphanis]|nr:hypothetical protein K3495_g9703 [Podosphaera aphanis]
MPRKADSNEQLIMHRETQQRNRRTTLDADSFEAQKNLAAQDTLSSSSLDDDVNSGKSSTPTSDPSHWFEQFNTNPSRTPAQFTDNESPYFVHSCASNEDEKSHPNVYLSGQPNGSKSSDDEYRSVIDDLTIQNKKLKEKIRQYRKKSSNFLEKDKLFEVRIHSLPPEKRRELEAALQTFASSLHASSSCDPISATQSSQLFSVDDPATISPHIKSSATSHKFSLLPSSFNISTLPSDNSSGFPANMFARKMTTPVYPEPPVDTEIRAKSKISNARTLAKTHADKQKKKLVVKRLERLFTGKAVPVPEYEEPISPHDEAFLAPQGLEQTKRLSRAPTREACMNTRVEDEVFLTSHQNKNSKITTPDSSHSDQTISENSSNEQRATHIFDLDPDRAQIPSENVEYIRHLGFENVFLSDIEAANSTEKTKGPWIYLNLLINMAQLHIINVTPDFVRSAVADVSEKFEVSSDGQMLRWRGGFDPTNLSSDTAGSSEHESDTTGSWKQNNQMSRPKQYNPVRVRSASSENISNPMSNSKSNKFQYQPLFRHQSSSRSSSESNDSLESEEVVENVNFNNSHSRQSWQRLVGKPKSEGLIVFYNEAEFCTDLSGESLTIVTPSEAAISEGSCIDETYTSKIHPRTESGSCLSYRPFKSTPEDVMSIDSEENTGQELDLSDGITKDLEIIFDSSLPTDHQLASSSMLNESFGASLPSKDRFEVQVVTRRSTITPRQMDSTAHLGFSSTDRSIEQVILERLSSLSTGLSPCSSRNESSKILPVQADILSVRYKSLT